MSRAIDSIYTIVNNPYRMMEIILMFYEEYNNKEKDFLLSYLILPLILNDDSRSKIKNLNSRSNLISLTKDSKSVVGLEMMIDEYKEITNKCIHICLSRNLLVLGENLDLIRTEKTYDRNSFDDTSIQQATKRLSFLMSKYDVVSVYRMLGVKNI